MPTNTYVPLPQGAGYAVVVGLGFVFAAAMMLTTYVLRRYNREVITAEEFATAGRSVKKSLISAAVVSSWTWAATLLTSTTQTYSNGIAGAFYYAAGATCQIVLFACLAIKAKERAPGAHTYLEIVRQRYGTATHAVMLFFGIAANILVTAMLLSGGSAVVNDLTGMNVVAACLLLPLGVVLYTLFGGIKATFLTDYAHTVVIVVIIMVFTFSAFATSDKLGSPGVVWEIVTKLAKENPREGNAGGSYLTMHSHSGGIFFVINIVGNFGTVFLDNGYFNKAFAANPAAALPGYIMGGLAWFAIPMLTSTCLGLVGLSLENTKHWPTYPNKLTPEQVSAGLVLPNAAVALLGKGGAVCSLLLIFMAVTSAMSAELIAVSTIFTYDIYRSYVNPTASGKRLIMMSHMSVIVFAYTMAGFAIGLYYAGISMGYLYELMGIIISGAVFPSTMTLFSKRQNKVAATATPIISTGLAIMSWLICTKKQFGSISVATTFEDNAMLTGNVVALLSPLVISPLLTIIFKPQNFDWAILRQIRRVDEEEELQEEENKSLRAAKSDPEKLEPVKSAASIVASEIVLHNQTKLDEETKILHKSFKFAVAICVTLTLCLVILWPMPMYGTSYVFSKRFFTGWIVVLIIWIFFTTFVVIIGPIWEGRDAIFTTMRGIYWDCTGQTYKLREWQQSNPEKLHAVRSQVDAQLLTYTQSEIVQGRAPSDYITPIDEVMDEKEDKSFKGEL
ncbi:Piso0_000242 [Millerozyma farinosa CBS 7064]|uniref:Piso0_000242 protein n=1 Tax=Pichia sorbitophila (strain ATCC MYA-4447 / BCRC 22081 / CBS 7064 / NBRC 10061 / NRRL Y-12695) TaxID=559304 RepID=G8YUW9_PICSO|nr:Piso0_000242 [Millerozyma farinosa CBS 7064]